MNVQPRSLVSNAAGQVSLPIVGSASLAHGATDFAQLLQRAGQSADPGIRADVAPLPQAAESPRSSAAQARAPKPPEAPRDPADGAEPSHETESEVASQAAEDAAASARNRAARQLAQRGADRAAGRAGPREARAEAEAAAPVEADAESSGLGSASSGAEDDRAVGAEMSASGAVPDRLQALAPTLSTAQTVPADSSEDASSADLRTVGSPGAIAAMAQVAQRAVHGTAHGDPAGNSEASTMATTGAPVELSTESSAAISATAAHEAAGAPSALAIPEGFSPNAFAAEWRTAAAGGASAAAGPAAAPSRTEQVDTPVGASDFGAALGTRISVLARDGIEHARLNVHPAELGPIALRLVLDGTQVRVDMAADSGETRQALEQSLPALASALRDAGFTLAGGGVFQQPRDDRQAQSQHDGAPDRPARKADDAADQAPFVGTRLPAAQGLVDLFA